MPKTEKKRKPIAKNKYLKYTGIGTKMAGTILAGVLIGQYMDKHFENETAYWTAGLSLFGVLGSFISLFYSLKHDNETD